MLRLLWKHGVSHRRMETRTHIAGSLARAARYGHLRDLHPGIQARSLGQGRVVKPRVPQVRRRVGPYVDRNVDGHGHGQTRGATRDGVLVLPPPILCPQSCNRACESLRPCHGVHLWRKDIQMQMSQHKGQAAVENLVAGRDRFRTE